MTDFADPATGGDKLPLDELKGALVIFDVHEVVDSITTSFGDTTAIRCDVSALDGAHAGHTWADTLIFPKVLQGSLRPNVGRKVLGRVGQGTAKPGQSPPWILEAATDADKVTANAFVAAQPKTDAPF